MFNATYSNLNALLARSGVEKLALEHELTEIALVEVPPELARVGVTVMCGPFFSFMPFPPRKLHSLSHVRYTPHRAWRERDVDVDDASFLREQGEPSFVPAHAEGRRALLPGGGELPSSATRCSSSRPSCRRASTTTAVRSLFRRHAELPGLVSVLGGKIDNIYDLERELDLLFGRGVAA